MSAHRANNVVLSSLAVIALCTTLATPVLAAGKGGEHGNSDHAQSDHGQSGEDHGNNNGNGNGNGGNHGGNGEVASLAGPANAAHASINGFLHASPNSELGRLRAYADANSAALGDQTIIDDFQTANPDFATLTDAEIAALPDGPAYLAALDDLSTVQASAADAFAATGAKPGSEAYVNGLLTKYYAYLAAQ
jgi:hypothetical protein